MLKFDIARQFEGDLNITQRVSTVMQMFGVNKDRLSQINRLHKCEVEVQDGSIVYITGPSGAGKSVLLREIQNQIPPDERIAIDEIKLPTDKAVIDCIGLAAKVAEKKYNKKSISAVSACSAVSLTTIEAMRLLGYAGLSDVFYMLTAPANLSEGQKYRFRLACCLASCLGSTPSRDGSGKKIIFADEFCSNLDRITAGVIAYNVRRFAKRAGVTFFLASSHEDILADLQPDVLVVKHFTGAAEVNYKELRIKN
jgi:ABC-type ATPase with predicted acetyltransferase domain